MMEMKVIESLQEVNHVALVGRLDARGVFAIEEKFRGYVESNVKPTLVDLSGVTDIASVGMRMLIAVFKVLRQNGVQMVLVKPQPLVEDALRTASLDQLFCILRDEKEAFKRLLGI